MFGTSALNYEFCIIKRAKQLKVIIIIMIMLIITIIIMSNFPL